MPTAAVTARRRRINAVKWSALTGEVGPGYADGLSYADGPRRRISSFPDDLVYADGPHRHRWTCANGPGLAVGVEKPSAYIHPVGIDEAVETARDTPTGPVGIARAHLPGQR